MPNSKNSISEISTTSPASPRPVSKKSRAQSRSKETAAVAQALQAPTEQPLPGRSIFASRMLRSLGAILALYGLIGLIALVFIILAAKYALLMREPSFFLEVMKKTPPETLSSGEILFLRFVFEVPGLVFGGLFGALGALLSYLRSARILGQSNAARTKAYVELSIGSLMGMVVGSPGTELEFAL